jgi:mRNA deadenylase 3'-5' endonuclease subunit Ccr4
MLRIRGGQNIRFFLKPATWVFSFWISLAVIEKIPVSAFANHNHPVFTRKTGSPYPAGIFPPKMSEAEWPDTDEDYCEVVDEFGSSAFEKYCKGESEDCLRWLRVEKDPDDCFKNVTTREGVFQKIAAVREMQGRYGQSDLLLRQWEGADAEQDSIVTGQSINGAGKPMISVMQFNSLAEGLSSGPTAKRPFRVHGNGQNEKFEFGGFSAIRFPSISLDFELRRWRLLEVILGTKVLNEETESFDLIALEEIDRYHGFFAPVLRMFGYEGLFQPKPRSPGVRMGWYSDGCCLFWKKDVFELVSERRLEYQTGSQIMIVAVLLHKSSKKPIVVAATHLKADKSEANEMIRCRQVQELMEEVDAVVLAATKDGSDDTIPVLILGDFNADPPSCIVSGTSSIGQLLAHNRVAASSDTKSKHFQSAYEIDPPPDSLYTTWKIRGANTSKRVIDYIFFAGALACKAVLRIPGEAELEETKLPGLAHPSDHMMIGAKFEIN